MKIFIPKKITEVLSESFDDCRVIVASNEISIQNTLKEIEFETHAGTVKFLRNYIREKRKIIRDAEDRWTKIQKEMMNLLANDVEEVMVEI